MYVSVRRDPRQLVGIAKLDVRESLGQIEGGGSSAVLLHDCAVDVRDIFKGSMAGQLLISIRKGVEIHDGLVESQEDAKGRGVLATTPFILRRYTSLHVIALTCLRRPQIF